MTAAARVAEAAAIRDWRETRLHRDPRARACRRDGQIGAVASRAAPVRASQFARQLSRARGPSPLPGSAVLGEPLLVGERLDHLLGDVDALARAHNRVLQDQVELLGLGDLLDHLVRALLDARELLVAAQVQVLAELALGALDVAGEVGEVALLVAAVGSAIVAPSLSSDACRSRTCLVSLASSASRAANSFSSFCWARLRRRRLAEHPLGVDEADLVVGGEAARRECRKRNLSSESLQISPLSAAAR